MTKFWREFFILQVWAQSRANPLPKGSRKVAKQCWRSYGSFKQLTVWIYVQIIGEFWLKFVEVSFSPPWFSSSTHFFLVDFSDFGHELYLKWISMMCRSISTNQKKKFGLKFPLNNQRILTKVCRSFDILPLDKSPPSFNFSKFWSVGIVWQALFCVWNVWNSSFMEDLAQK